MTYFLIPVFGNSMSLIPVLGKSVSLFVTILHSGGVF